MKNPLKNKTFEESLKSRGVFRTHASIYDGAFFVNILNGFIFLQYKFHHRSSTGLYIGLWKYWDFQSEAKVEQMIAIVTTHSVSCSSHVTHVALSCQGPILSE